MGSASVKLDEQRRVVVALTPCYSWVTSPPPATSACEQSCSSELSSQLIRMIIIKYKQILVKSPGAGGGRPHVVLDDYDSEETEGGHQALQVLSNHHALQQCLVFDYQESPRQRRRRSVCLRKMKTLQKPQPDSKQFHHNNNNKS